MELKPQLSHQLRQLRMSGVMETLDTRTRQAIDGQWSYVEFLSRLLEDETERRAQKQRDKIPQTMHGERGNKVNQESRRAFLHQCRMPTEAHGRRGRDMHKRSTAA